MTNNEKKMLSRNTKRRINRENKIIDYMKQLFNKFKLEEKKKCKIFDKIRN